MLYDQADIVARRLMGQKVGEAVAYESAQDAKEIKSILIRQARVVITAPRQSGKTTELLRYAVGKYPSSRFCIVCLNQNVQQHIIQRHYDLFIAGNIAKRLTGQPTDGVNVNPPLMLTPANIHLLIVSTYPIFIDEYNLIPEDIQQTILDSGMFEAAVTS